MLILSLLVTSNSCFIAFTLFDNSCTSIVLFSTSPEFSIKRLIASSLPPAISTILFLRMFSSLIRSSISVLTASMVDSNTLSISFPLTITSFTFSDNLFFNSDNSSCNFSILDIIIYLLFSLHNTNSSSSLYIQSFIIQKKFSFFSKSLRFFIFIDVRLDNASTCDTYID